MIPGFLDAAHDLWKLGRVNQFTKQYESVFSAIATLQTVHSKARLDLNNVEIIFSALEMARLIKSFPGRLPEQIDGLIEALKTVIVTTLEQTILFTVEAGGHIRIPEPYGAFANLMDHLRKSAAPKHRVSVLTFNYDVCADASLELSRIPYGYALTADVPDEQVRLLKLHGSLNWTENVETHEIVPWHLKEYFRTREWPYRNNYNYLPFPIGSSLPELKRLNPAISGSPVLVAPTSSKSEHHRMLSAVWAAAAKELSSAENIFVIGYSMPNTDAFFHYLYALGTVGETPLKRFWVFDPDKSGTVDERYRKLLGPGAESRYRYYQKAFDTAIPTILNEFPKR